MSTCTAGLAHAITLGRLGRAALFQESPAPDGHESAATGSAVACL